MNAIPEVGAIVKARQRQYLVEGVEPGRPGDATLVRMACVDDDAQGEALEAFWELEPDALTLKGAGWEGLAERGFDPPQLFSSYLHALRWNCVTATDPKLFQAPFRAGIKIEAYQLEPLRKALLLPRVNLFIADDVGLGKTIEAGLIARELILRKKVREVVVVCPPSILPQWKSELEQRFGLGFEILDREYVTKVKQERGFATNPWKTHSRFLISNRLLIDEIYAAPLRDWLGTFSAGSLLILDEAHHAAPSSGGKYAIDSKITRAIRDLAPRFEHRLFLSATPHNGHSNSFSALLEILDPQRFIRGVPVKGKATLDAVMVRRIKDDIRTIQGGFPLRKIVQIDIDGLPTNAPELRLAELLDEYRRVREEQVGGESKRAQAASGLLTIGLQQRLLSSIEAFARTLKVHKRTLDKQSAKGTAKVASEAKLGLFAKSVDADDERAELGEEELERDEEAQVEAATELAAGGLDSRTKKLLEEMTTVAEQARGLPDARTIELLRWIGKRQCPGVKVPGESRKTDKSWTPTRAIVFTEYEATLGYLRGQIDAAIAGSDRAEERVEVFRGSTSSADREEIKRKFNADPAQYPLRILLCTDAAREGINLQSHCADLFHFDVPWNPARMEQRNGRIDRKLQASPDVRCHYFVYAQRSEDRILKALVKKTETIKKELGSLSQVIEGTLAETLTKSGIRRKDVAKLEKAIDDADLGENAKATVTEELEAARERQEDIAVQIEKLREQINDSRGWINLQDGDERFKQAISCGLQLAGAEALKRVANAEGRYEFPSLDEKEGGDATWADALDALRTPKTRAETFWEWRRKAKVRPVVFNAPEVMTDDVVHLHLEHPVVKRLLGRFTAQGFIMNDLSRACFAQTTDAVPRVVLLGRLCLYGAGAARLHEEIIAVTARWIEPERRQGKPLSPYAREAEGNTLQLLEEALAKGVQPGNAVMSGKLQKAGPQDAIELQSHLEERGEKIAAEVAKKLALRGDKEAAEMQKIIADQKKRIEQAVSTANADQLTFDFDSEEERRQREADRVHWGKRLIEIDRELSEEPRRIREVYAVKAKRVEPIGLAYLWPATG